MHKRVLLCDDEMHIIRAAEIKLVKAGFEVVSTHDGQQAWEEIQRTVPDLVVTDCQMPRMNGVELVQHIRAYEPARHVPIFMLTGKGLELDAKALREELGIMYLLDKPFSPRDLVSRVQAVLERLETPVTVH